MLSQHGVSKHWALSELERGTRPTFLGPAQCPTGSFSAHIQGGVLCVDPSCPFNGLPKETMKNPNESVYKAFGETTVAYFNKVCSMRAQGGSGSFYPNMTAHQVSGFIRSLAWRPFDHPEVKSPCRAFIADHDEVGVVGVVPAEQVPEDAQLFTEDPKNTGNVDVVWRTEKQLVQLVHFTVVILGPDGDNESVYTFHPGDPVPASRIPRRMEFGELGVVDLHGKRVSRAFLKEYNVKWVKLAQVELNLTGARQVLSALEQ